MPLARLFRALAVLSALSALLLPVAGCGLTDALNETLNKQVGESCSTPLECDYDKGLVCAGNGTCQKDGDAGTGILGAPCEADQDCRMDIMGPLACHTGGFCSTAGMLGAGNLCDVTNHCVRPLICSGPVEGEMSGICKDQVDDSEKRREQGTGEAGDPCVEFWDCALGLLCGPGGTCDQLPFYRGRSCPVTDLERGALRALFDVPEKGAAPEEFYRIPFPADFRKTSDGFIDLTSHPDPDTGRPADMAGTYIDHVQATATGFSTTAALYFRFSGRLDAETLKSEGADATIHFVDVDRPGEPVPFEFDYRPSRGKYICDDRLALRPVDGYPLREGATYAAYVTNGVKGYDGAAVGRDEDFEAMMGSTPPAEERLTAAYAGLGPLRSWAVGQPDVDPATIVTGTVFTTAKIYDPIRGMKLAVAEAPKIEATSITLCEGGAESPCADDGTGSTQPDRGCGSGERPFHEIHMKLSVPVFQRGTAPYLVADAGGNIELDEHGKAKMQRRERLPVALTIPKAAAMPDTGWPIIIFGHGTGGNFKGFTNGSDEDPSFAHLASSVAVGNQTVHFAMLGFDQVQHGPRRTEAKADGTYKQGTLPPPDSLFFNFLNPKAARDNTLQGAGDIFSLVRAVKDPDLLKDKSPLGEAIKFDSDQIYYFGHSQGTVTGPPGVVFEPGIKAVVMSGAGGNLVKSLLNKTQPVNLKDAIRWALADDSSDEFHEILNILQHHIAPSDTINYGRQFFLEPPTGVPPKHVLHIYGLRDHYAPEPNQRAFAQAMGVTHLGPDLNAVTTAELEEGLPEGLSEAEKADRVAARRRVVDRRLLGVDNHEQDGTSLKGNITVAGGKTVTAGVIQYVPTKSEQEDEFTGEMAMLDDYDGHFVVYNDPGAKIAWPHFFATAVLDADGVPTIKRAP